MIDLGYDEGGACDILLVSLQFGQTSELQILREKWEARLGTIKYFHSKDYDNFSHGVFVGLSPDACLVYNGSRGRERNAGNNLPRSAVSPVCR